MKIMTWDIKITCDVSLIIGNWRLLKSLQYQFYQVKVSFVFEIVAADKSNKYVRVDNCSIGFLKRN